MLQRTVGSGRGATFSLSTTGARGVGGGSRKFFGAREAFFSGGGGGGLGPPHVLIRDESYAASPPTREIEKTGSGIHKSLQDFPLNASDAMM